MVLIIVFGLIIIANFILQSTILPYLGILGIVPNTGLIIIVIISLLKGRYYGSFLGLIIGLIQDIIFSSVIGINAFIYFTLGYIIGKIGENFSGENIVLPVFFSGISTIYYNSSYLLFMYFLSRQFPNNILLNNIFTFEILYNSLVSILIYKLLLKIFVSPSLKFGKR